MKNLHLITIMLGCILFASCNYSKGVKKDLRTGLTLDYNGFGVQDVLLLDSSNKPMTNNVVQLNTKVAIAAVGVTNYGLKDGKAFPGMMLVVTDKKGSPIINAADLFEGAGGYNPADATELRGSITVGNPMVSGQTYHVKLRIWDKVKPESVINSEVNLVVQ
jgi:predicted small secreted protein